MMPAPVITSVRHLRHIVQDLLFLGLCVSLPLHFTLMFWSPSVAEEYVLYILSGTFGITNGIWLTQINGNILSLLVRISYYNKDSMCKRL